MAVEIYTVLMLFAGISAFNLGLFYLVQSLKKSSFSYMALGTFLFSICVFFAFYEVTSLYEKFPQFMWINGPILFAIGPMFYLHVKKKKAWKDFLHFIPLLLLFIWIFPFYIKPAAEKLEFILAFYHPMGKSEIEIFQYLYVLHIGIYCFLGYEILRRKNLIFQEYDSSTAQKKLNKRSQQLYLLISVTSILSFIACFLCDIFGVYYGIVDKYTIVLLVLLILLLQIYFTFNGYDEKIELEIIDNQIKNFRNSISSQPEEASDYPKIMEYLNKLMTEEKLYRNPNLKITEVAEKLNISMHRLSAVINQQHGNNFFDYINTLRVEELKETLPDDANKHLTLFAIARASGFKSNSSFYRVFKKYTGCTPKEYIKTHS